VFIWILVALVALASGAYVAYRRQRPALPAPEEGAAALLERTVKDVRPNDVIQHDGHDYLVEGVVKYDEDGHTWSAARMIDGNRERWLLVGLERGSQTTVRVLAPTRELELSGYPPETLDHDGASWKLGSRGTATATFQGDLSTLPGAPAAGTTQRCRWWKYQAAGEKILFVEQWGETYRALAGETVRADQVELLAAS
jgi:Domain of unknown function (DUF4178)